MNLHIHIHNTEELKEALEILKGFGGIKTVSSTTIGNRGPNEVEWLQKTKGFKMKLSAAEKQRVDSGEVTREDIAFERLQNLGGSQPAVFSSEVFDDEEEEDLTGFGDNNPF